MLKAQILLNCSQVQFIDVSHSILPYDISLASYYQRSMLSILPAKAINLVAVNNHYCERSRFILFEHHGQYFIGPDNGVFSLVFEDFEYFDLYEIVLEDALNSKNALKYYTHAITCILHEIPLNMYTAHYSNSDIKIDFKPVTTNNQLRAQVIHIDTYGNVVTNLPATLFREVSAGKKFKLYYNPHDPIDTISKGYASVNIGEPLCLFNDAGLLEIAVYMQEASTLLNLNVGDTIQIDLF